MSYQEEYEKRLNILKRQLDLNQKSYEKSKKKYETLKENGYSEKESERDYSILKRKEYGIEVIKNELEYIRCATDKTESEKASALNDFEKNFKEIYEEDPQYFFHGCKSIALVKQIIESGEISSGAARTGVETSFDTEYVISVTGYSNMSVTIDGYCGLQGEYSYNPPGALFILKTEDYNNTTITAAPVDFKKQPEKLVAILSTSENKERIKMWLQQNGYDTEKVSTFEEFIEKEREEKVNISGQELGKQVISEMSDVVLTDETEKMLESQERELTMKEEQK